MINLIMTKKKPYSHIILNLFPLLLHVINKKNEIDCL